MKRFYKKVSAVEDGGAFLIHLDGRPVKTPAKAALTLPTSALASAVVQEWDAQDEKIDPQSMPNMRFASTAIDRVRPNKPQIAGQVAAYAETDLLCYRAERPAELAERQAVTWQPFLDWCADRYNARLKPTDGIVPVQQDAAALAALSHQVQGLDEFTLTAVHELTSVSGSLVLALAVADGYCAAADAADAGQLDESYQSEVWGYEKESADIRARRRGDMIAAEAFLALLNE